MQTPIFQLSSLDRFQAVILARKSALALNFKCLRGVLCTLLMASNVVKGLSPRMVQKQCSQSLAFEHPSQSRDPTKYILKCSNKLVFT